MENKDVVFSSPKFTDPLNSIHRPWPPCVSHVPLLGDSAILWRKVQDWPRGRKAFKSSLCGHSLYFLKKLPLTQAQSLEEETRTVTRLRTRCNACAVIGGLVTPMQAEPTAPPVSVPWVSWSSCFFASQLTALEHRHPGCGLSTAASSALPGNLLEKQNLGLHPRSTETKSEF